MKEKQRNGETSRSLGVQKTWLYPIKSWVFSHTKVNIYTIFWSPYRHTINRKRIFKSFSLFRPRKPATAGADDHRTRRGDHRSQRPREPTTTGADDRRNQRPQEPTTTGANDHRSQRPQEPETTGAKNQRC